MNSGLCVLPDPKSRRRGAAVLRGATVRERESAGLVGLSRAAAGAVTVPPAEAAHLAAAWGGVPL